LGTEDNVHVDFLADVCPVGCQKRGKSCRLQGKIKVNTLIYFKKIILEQGL
jgi:uncharacterized pyridoxamine 5'-phosphate oxidase family protein